MAQRGRKSAAALSVIRVDGRPKRITPRAGCPLEVAVVFNAVAEAVAPEHFRAADGDLLEQFSQSVVLARQAYSELERDGPVIDGKASAWLTVLEKAHRSATALSVRLRLGPQTRLDARAVGRQKQYVGPAPWEV